ncbi:4'-phosphopantetheinyl transferase superfamily protein [Bacillus sp. DX4.1]|uniref:4'-phosphopantetheinyl transferase family protein n=1 Tax=Bacillus sp. DX4.1 TaxID=3055867 RepID=UPI0025A0C250|nr:4'-phosphopantetheinyl transferase superfamily protein [Bacillus sp. DX4.1]MDM5187175.1 4'-phosphopantetheinyl transferase superfamily protein [Bacillus sp. DX4.1]
MILIVKMDINNYDLATLMRLLPLLEQETQLQVSRFQMPEDKKRTLLGNYVAKCLIARYTQQNIEHVHFTTNAYGKKTVQKSPISFNLSHAGKWVVIALSTNESIGVDVEKMEPIDIWEVATFFSIAEQRYLKGLVGEEAEHAFYRIWTAKESFLKCIGRGLSQPLDTFIVPLHSSAQPQSIESATVYSNTIQVYSFQIDSEHWCSISTNDFKFPVDIMTLSKDFSVLTSEQMKMK